VSTHRRFGRLRAHRVLIVGVLAVGLASTLRAQDGNGLSIGANLGGGHGLGGGPYVNRGAVATDLLVAFRLHQADAGGVIVSIAREWHGAGPGDSICLPEPNGDCTPAFPQFSSTVALAGWEEGRQHAGTARVLAGFGYYRSHGGHSIGAQGRAELATPAAGHLALVGFARGDLLPRVFGGALALWAVGVGIRLE
jgi:hypothetical protein